MSTQTAAPPLASFSELRELARKGPVRTWLERSKRRVLWRDWDIVPSAETARQIQGDYRAMRTWAKANEEALGFFRQPDPDFYKLDTWLSRSAEDLLTADAVVIYLREPQGGTGCGLLGSDIVGLRLLDAATVEPAVNALGVLQGYVQYIGEVPRRTFADISAEPIAAGPLDMKLLHRYPKERCLYLSMNPRRDTPFGQSPLEKALVRREDGTIDADATARLLPGALPDADLDPVTGLPAEDAAAFREFLARSLFDAVLDRCAGGSLRWQWGDVLP